MDASGRFTLKVMAEGKEIWRGELPLKVPHAFRVILADNFKGAYIKTETVFIIAEDGTVFKEKG